MASKARELADAIGERETAGGLVSGRKNLIINGAMQVAQRGTSITGISSAGYYAGADRMRRSANNLNATLDREQSTDAPTGFSYSLKETVTTAALTQDDSDAYRPLNIRMEGQDLQCLGYGTSDAKDATLSFWVKSSVTGTYVVSIIAYDSNGDMDLINKPYTIDTANTWEYKTLTISGNTSGNIRNTNETGFDMMWVAGSGSDWAVGTDTTSWGDYSGGVGAGLHYGQTAQVAYTLNATWQITGVQLEVGSVATPFEHRSYGEELALCQRYYQKASDSNGMRDLPVSVYNTSNSFGMFLLPQTMRAAPSASVTTNTNLFSANAGHTITGITVSETSIYHVSFYIDHTTITAGNAALIYPNYTADAEL